MGDGPFQDVLILEISSPLIGERYAELFRRVHRGLPLSDMLAVQPDPIPPLPVAVPEPEGEPSDQPLPEPVQV